MSRRERRHSFDCIPVMDDDYYCTTNNSRRVHFDDEQINYAMDKGKRHTASNVCNQFDNTELTVHEITAKLKHSYENIDHGLAVLKKVYDDLTKSKNRLCCGGHHAKCNKDNLAEIERLLKEVEILQCSLQKTGNRKRKYLEELSSLQNTLHSDRKKMENWVRASRSSKQKLQTKIDESWRVTRDQQALIQKLKSDNSSLWKILQEVQEHLRQESLCSSENSLDGYRDSVSKIPPPTPKQNREIESCNFTCDVYPVNEQLSSSSQDDRRMSDGGSSTSSQDQYLCEKLKKLLEQSENIQKLICNVGNNNHKHCSDKKSEDSEDSFAGSQTCCCNTSKKSHCEKRIPSENERGVRSDANDIIRRCEELERKVEACSTKHIRERVMQQLHEIDSETSSSSSNEKLFCKGDHWTCSSNSQQQWKPDQHKRVREELLKCLDRIISLEKSFNEAQEEIQRLRKYIKETGEEKEFSEMSFKREAMELRLIVDDKSKEVDMLRENFNDALKGLQQSESLMNRVEELEQLLTKRDEEILMLKTGQGLDTRYLKMTLDAKNAELEGLKNEMKTAIDKMEKLKLHASQSDHQSTIQEELSLLQVAILEIERQLQILQEENILLKQDRAVKEAVSTELEIQNQTLMTQLKLSEEDNTCLRASLENLEKEASNLKFLERDSRIMELEDALSKLIEENEMIPVDPMIVSNVGDDPTQEMEEMITNLVRDNDKYLDLIKHKDGMIDELRESLKTLAEEVEKRFSSVTAPSDTEDVDKKLTPKDIVEELGNLRLMLDSSHQELVEKVVGLHKELAILRDENRLLQQQIAKSNPQNTEKNSVLRKQNQDLTEENAMLRDTLSKPYPGIVENILAHGKEIKRLHDENELLRLGLSKDKKELVGSNLRKRAKIKELEKQLDESQLLSPLSSSHSKRRRSSSQGNHPTLQRLLSPERTDGERSSNPATCSKQSPESSTRTSGMATPSKKDALAYKEVFDEMKKQNEVILKLHKGNEKLKIRSDEEIATLKDERDRLKQNMKSNTALEEELNALRKALKDLNNNSDLAAKERRIEELETEVEKWKAKEQIAGYSREDGVTPRSSPDRSQLSLGPFNEQTKNKNLKSLLSENLKLKRDLEKVNSDLTKLAKITERLKNDNTANNEHSLKQKNLEDKIRKVEADNKNLKHGLEDSQNENNDIADELLQVKRDLSNAVSAKDQATEEMHKLRGFIKDLHENKKDEGLNKMVQVLSDSLDDMKVERQNLEEKFEKAENEKNRLEKETNTRLKNNKATSDKKLRQLENEKDEIHQRLLNVNKELTGTKEENKELEIRNRELEVELEKVCNDISETHFADWFQKDADRRIALLSPDTHRDSIMDTVEKQARKDQARVIRKLQIENQTFQAKLLSLEDESIATTKIIADMERGHGHLTGTLRCHLILQKNTTAKLLEGSLQQYTGDFEILEKKFKSLEEKYDKEKRNSKRRDHAWDLFTNASATINNIHTILNEGLVKVEEDLEHELSDAELEEKDYKSRLWILRRRLSDVENRHRELHLCAEELSLRLDAKTTEFEVTQDELEDTTRDLESRETSIQKLKDDLKKLSEENAKLTNIIMSLKENQDQTVGAVLEDNITLQNIAENMKEQHDIKLKNVESNMDEIMAKLDEKDAALNIMKKLRDASDKEIDELKRRVAYLEKKLKEVTNQRDKLKKEAEYRAGYMGGCHDDHGTIHMLRDDLKKLAKENANLKQDIVLKQHQIYDMSKDSHNLRMMIDLDASRQERKPNKKDETAIKMIQDLSELKAQKFLLETKLKDLERRMGTESQRDENFLEKAFKEKLAAKEKEIERMKREKTFTKDGKSPNITKDDTMSDIGLSVFDSTSDNKSLKRELQKTVNELKQENQVLQDVIAQKKLTSHADFAKSKKSYEKKIEKQNAELETLSKDVDTKRKKIKELLNEIQILKEAKIEKSIGERIPTAVKKATDDEMETVMKKLERKDLELNEWKSKAVNDEKELQRLKSTQSGFANDDDKFKDLYLNEIVPMGIAPSTTPAEGYLDRETPQNVDAIKNPFNATPRSGINTDAADSGFPSSRRTQDSIPPNSQEHTYINTNLIDLGEPAYEELAPYEVMEPTSAIPRPNRKALPDAPKKVQPSNATSKIPVFPPKKKRPPGSSHANGYEVSVDGRVSSGGDSNQRTSGSELEQP